MRPLESRNAIVTGASQGLGLAIARAYVSAGANVLVCARTAESLDGALSELKAIASSGQIVAARQADVSSQDDVRRLTAEALGLFSQVHILVSNAGVYGPKGAVDEVDWDQWVRAVEINLLGSVLMCRALVSHFKARGYGKIVQISGGGATNPLPRLSAYAASKAGIVRFVETLAEEVRQSGIDVNAIAPGALNTRLLEEILESGPEKVGRAFYERSLAQKHHGGTPPEKAAALAVFLGSAASDGITGKLISAVWDPWEDLPQYRENLDRTDVYTLRRILPKDRGMTWGEHK